MILTTSQFDRSRDIGFCLPHTDIGPGNSVVVGTVRIAEGSMVDVKWMCVHLSQMDGVTSNGGLVKVSRASSKLTASTDFFTQDDVGSIITLTSSSRMAKITGFTSGTSVSISASGVGAMTDPDGPDYFVVHPTMASTVNTALGPVNVGIYSELVDQFEMPAGYPGSSLSIGSPGVALMDPNVSRLYSGPETLSIVVSNNTRNFGIKVGVTAVLRRKIG